jgi:WD40 repeat protein
MHVFSNRRGALAQALLSAFVLAWGTGFARAEGGPAPHVNDTVSVASFCLGENAFVTGGIFGRLFKWSMETGEVVSTYTFPNDDDRSMFTARCSSNGTRIAVGLDNFMVAVWDGTPGKINGILTGQDPETGLGDVNADVHAVSLSADAKLIAAGHGKKVDIWMADGGKLLRQIKTKSPADAVAFINSGREIAILDQSSRGGGNRTMSVWNVRTGKRVREFAPVSDSSSVSVVSADGNVMASGGVFGIVTVWDVASGKLKSQFQAADDLIEALALAPDKRSVLVGQESGEIAWLNAATGEEIGRLVGHTDKVKTVSFSPDGRRILSGSDDGTFRLWDAREQKTVLVGEAGGSGWASWTPEFAFVTSSGEAFKVFSHYDYQTLQFTPNLDFTDDKARPDLVEQGLAQ